MKKRLFVGRHVAVGRNFHIGILSFVTASESLKIGDDVYIGKFCSIQCNGEIGDGVLIANNVGLIGRVDHDFRAVGVLVRTSPHVSNDEALKRDARNSVVIGSDTWIGFGAVVLSGITIGRGAVIAAGSVVTRSVKPYEIVAGNPAKVIGSRFSEADIARHEAIVYAGQSATR